MNPSVRDRLLILLSLGAGAIDAVLLLKLQVFPANMTGNTVMLGVSLAKWNLPHLVPAVLALTGFALGALTGGKLLQTEKREWSHGINRLLLIGAGLILIAGFPGWIGLQEQIWLAAPLCAAAMGLQAVAALQVGVPGVSTNVVTSSITTAMARFSGSTPAQAALPLKSWFAYFGGALAAALLVAHIDWHALWVPASAMIGAVLWSRRHI